VICLYICHVTTTTTTATTIDAAATTITITNKGKVHPRTDHKSP